MDKYNIIIGVDPGLSGGITVLDGKKQPQIHEIPLTKIVVNKKAKNIYDLDEIAKILEKYRGENVLYTQEQVSAMPGNGNVSMFGFGFSAGSTLGIAAGIGFDRYEVRPQKWKKHFPELFTQIFKDLKDEAREIRASGKPAIEQLKKLKALKKTIKDKAQKTENNKEIDKVKKEVALNEAIVTKINARAKTESKKASRALASKLYPNLSDRFKRVKDDGLAESLLIAIFGRDTQDELV